MSTHLPIFSPDAPVSLVACGILKKELRLLVQKRGWNIETLFLASALHNYLDKLSGKLNEALSSNEEQGKRSIVVYGTCHPLMNKMLDKHQAVRVQGQNCIVMLLGHELFMQHLSKGAYFLLEDWALTWQPMITSAFGKNLEVVREIFNSSHKYMLAIRTPCSTDFEAAAQDAARFVNLPLQWLDADLDHLELVLEEALARTQESHLGPGP